MYGDIGDKGYLKISSENDRAAVANILYKNGYTVQPTRRRKNGRSFEYYVMYEMKENTVDEQ